MKLGFIFFGLLMAFSSSILYGQEKTKKIPDEVLRAAKDSNSFAIQAYQQLSEIENICYSPFSISSAFAMVYAGAQGDTKQEIMQVMHYPTLVEETNKAWAWLNQFFTFYPSNSSEDLRVKIANSLWVQSNFPVLPSFRDTMSNYFGGAFRFVDFKLQTETARATINAWVKQNTFGKITDILSPQSLDKSTRMVLISALYLKAKWQNQFDSHLTTQQPFFLKDGNLKTVLSMTQAADFPYFSTSEASILDMPYTISRKDGPEFSMLIVLPHQKEGLFELEKRLTAEKMEDWISKLERTRVIVTIPKFKTLQSSNLNELFTKMGMQLPFTDQADFSGISNVKGLKIGDVLHKVYLSIDETGSEAAAATAIRMNVTAVREQKSPIVFQADHPFLYIIYEKTTGMILFMGHLEDPTI